MCRLLIKTKIGKEEKLFETALAAMKRGGPDASHVLIENDIAFGHNRLSIIDTRSMADQPMMIDGNIILFNGEIYNHKALRERYNLPVITESDTEVILMLYNKLGDRAFDLLDGEFAIVIYDAEDQTIRVARDRLGIKQLYYSDWGDELIISSEIKGILPFIGDPTMDNDGFDQWLTYGYPIDSATMFSGVFKVMPNTLMEFDLDGNLLKSGDLGEPTYLEDKTPKENNLAQLIARCVGKRMMSDVPISCTLSGGIDSSIVAYVMSKMSKDPIKTYTFGFDDCDNEFEQARKVAQFIGSDHTEIHTTLPKILEKIDEILETIEEPVDRGSLVPTFCLASNIKEKVTLIGEGADELFAGYARHKWIHNNPNKTFDEYFDTKLRAFPTEEEPVLLGDWDDKNSALEFDLTTEIPNFHTIRIDKCLMHYGVEARVPFLDPEIVMEAAKISFSQKQGPEKKCLREAFRDILPDWIIDQPKSPLKLPFDRIVKLPAVEKLIREESEHFDNKLIDAFYANMEKDSHAARNLWNIFLFKKWEKKYLK